MGIGCLSKLGVEMMSIGYVYCSIAKPVHDSLEITYVASHQLPYMQCSFNNWLPFMYRLEIESSLGL